jgi:hypothetical protein
MGRIFIHKVPTVIAAQSLYGDLNVTGGDVDPVCDNCCSASEWSGV